VEQRLAGSAIVSYNFKRSGLLWELPGLCDKGRFGITGAYGHTLSTNKYRSIRNDLNNSAKTSQSIVSNRNEYNFCAEGPKRKISV
jgi:hypothetical protein